MLIDALILDCRTDRRGDCFTPDYLKELAEKPLSRKNSAITLNWNPKVKVGTIQKIWYKNRKLYAEVKLNKKLGTTIIEEHVLAPAVKIIKSDTKKIKGKVTRKIKQGTLDNLSLIDKGIRSVVNATMVFRKRGGE